MTLAVIVTLWVSLTLFGGGLLAYQQVELAKGRWYDRIEISVFLCNKVTPGDQCTPNQEVTAAEKDTIQRTLESNPEVQTVYFESKEEAYADFIEAYKDSPIRDTLSVDQMQESYRVKLNNPEQYEGMVSAVSGLAGVQAVQDLREFLDPLFNIMRTVQNLTIAASVLLLLSAALQIGNTIRLTAFARRREIGIMRLVGASNLYITLPFLFEAIFAAIIGAALACATLATGVYLLITQKAQVSIQSLPWIGASQTGWAMLWVAVVGIALSIIPTLVTTRKYLRV
jgi:cell division transport system permease protein